MYICIWRWAINLPIGAMTERPGARTKKKFVWSRLKTHKYTRCPVSGQARPGPGRAGPGRAWPGSAPAGLRAARLSSAWCGSAWCGGSLFLAVDYFPVFFCSDHARQPPASQKQNGSGSRAVSRSTFPVRLLRRFGPGSRPTVSSKVVVLRKRYSTFSKMLWFRVDERAFVELSQLKRLTKMLFRVHGKRFFLHLRNALEPMLVKVNVLRAREASILEKSRLACTGVLFFEAHGQLAGWIAGWPGWAWLGSRAARLAAEALGRAAKVFSYSWRVGVLEKNGVSRAREALFWGLLGGIGCTWQHLA